MKKENILLTLNCAEQTYLILTSFKNCFRFSVFSPMAGIAIGGSSECNSWKKIKINKWHVTIGLNFIFHFNCISFPVISNTVEQMYCQFINICGVLICVDFIDII